MKLTYYIDQQWEDEWIQISKSALYSTFKKSYLPPPGQEHQGSLADDFDPQDELSLHLYGKRKSKRTHAELDGSDTEELRNSELDEYLKKKRVCFKDPENENTLTWWKVSMRSSVTSISIFFIF
jgi:hypothetical protein